MFQNYVNLTIIFFTAVCVKSTKLHGAAPLQTVMSIAKGENIISNEFTIREI